MKLGVCAQALFHLPFESALALARELGFSAIELPVDAQNPFIDLDAALDGDFERIARAVADSGLAISALSNHREGQLLLGPHGEDTDCIHPGDAVEKVAYATARMEKTARLANHLGVSVVCGFTGCADYSRWFPWPVSDGYERMLPSVCERLLPVLDAFAKQDVVFAHECHPRQFAYNVETAQLALHAVSDHPAFAFNFDPANLLLAGVDPTTFVTELGHRIRHVHAKDGELVEHAAARSGLLAHGAWNRPGRGFRFRIPGWGDLDWRKLLSALHTAGFDGTVAVEHEDPTMGRIEGLKQAVRHLDPLLLHEPPEAQWW